MKSYLRDAMSRLEAQSRHEAVVQARRHGILPNVIADSREAGRSGFDLRVNLRAWAD